MKKLERLKGLWVSGRLKGLWVSGSGKYSGIQRQGNLDSISSDLGLVYIGESQVEPESVEFVPNVEVWKAGGCAACGAPARDGSWAHDACWCRLEPAEQELCMGLSRSAPSRSATNQEMSTRQLKPAKVIPTPGLIHYDLGVRTVQFLGGLNLQDHSRADQHEARDLIHALMAVLSPGSAER